MRVIRTAATLLLALAFPLAAQERLPSDPLTPAENERLVTVAIDYAQSHERLSRTRAKFAVVGTEIVDYKPERATREGTTPENAGRYGSVLLYRYDTNEGIRVIVDLRKFSGVSIARVSPQSTPVGREEIERAARLALANASVVRLIGGNADQFRILEPGSPNETGIEGLRVLGNGPNDRCSVNRCVDLFFRRDGGYIGGRVTVNLTAGSVLVAPVKGGQR